MRIEVLDAASARENWIDLERDGPGCPQILQVYARGRSQIMLHLHENDLDT